MKKKAPNETTEYHQQQKESSVRLTRIPTIRHALVTIIILCSASLLLAAPAGAGEPAGDRAWWILPLILFVSTFALGIVAVLGGVGGGVLFVPIIGGFFPIHLDYVRCTSLLVALAGALSAGPSLLRTGLADLRVAMPVAVVTSIGAIAGAQAGTVLPTHVVRILLGVVIIGIVIIMNVFKRSDFPEVKRADALSTFLGLGGTLAGPARSEIRTWHIHRMPVGLLLFVFVGFLAGMFGLGAGWANVPVLNLVLGMPLKTAVATSVFVLSITDTSAAWIYINKGAALPLLIVPSIAGVMLGAGVGARLLQKARPGIIRRIIIAILLFAAIRSILKGTGIWM